MAYSAPQLGSGPRSILVPRNEIPVLTLMFQTNQSIGSSKESAELLAVGS